MRRRRRNFETVGQLEQASMDLAASLSESVLGVVCWHLVEFVAEDTDRDNPLTNTDRRALEISDACGGNFIEAISNLGLNFSRELMELDSLHGNQSKQVAVRIDLPTHKLTSTWSLPNLGSR